MPILTAIILAAFVGYGTARRSGARARLATRRAHPNNL